MKAPKSMNERCGGKNWKETGRGNREGAGRLGERKEKAKKESLY